MATPVEVAGHCDARFAAVRDAFARNFQEGREVGASFAATVDGEFVVDLWAGHADAARTRPWERDTIVNVYSTTKVMTAIAALVLVDRGSIDLDAPVGDVLAGFRPGRQGEAAGALPVQPHVGPRGIRRADHPGNAL